MVGGHLGINMHLSELVSDIIDPVISTYDGGKEVISTEDMIARAEKLNDENENWEGLSFWSGMQLGEYESCTVCNGVEPHVREDGHPELCSCEDQDGISAEGRILITRGAMKRLRRLNWMENIGWDDGNITVEYDGREVLHEDLQHQGVPMVLIGTDVINLYPSLDIERVVEDVQQAILDSNITWREIDYLEAARYVALNWPEDKCRSSGLWRVLPKRRHKGGTRPGLRGVGPQGGGRGDQEQWIFPRVRLRQGERKLLVATVVKLATKAMFKHHFYGFAGSKFQQMEGGPIGLRGTCSIARLVMQIWDKKWVSRVEEAGLRLRLYTRYMDDGSIFLQPVKRGWRWKSGSLKYRKQWEMEDKDRSLKDITMEVIKNSMVGISSYLSFTYETGEDFHDGWLPTLDTNMVVDPDNKVLYKYFEKPSTTNTTIQKSTAMAENPKIQSLSNDLVRRLLNTKKELPDKYRAEVVDRYGIKLLTSGYGYEQTRKILMNGAKGYLNKVKRRTQYGGKLHRTAEESSSGRWKKKLLGKSTWFKDKKTDKKEGELDTNRKTGARSKEQLGAVSNLKTRAVLFVEQTPQGELARRIREQMTNLAPTLGFKVRIVERTGRNILTNFPQTRTWGAIQCGREECITCNQGMEELPDFTKPCVVYESICFRCNSGAKAKGELKIQEKGAPSLYVVESSRSVEIRAMDHWGAVKTGAQGCHVVKHQAMVHPGEQPEFVFKVISHHR